MRDGADRLGMRRTGAAKAKASAHAPQIYDSFHSSLSANSNLIFYHEGGLEIKRFTARTTELRKRKLNDITSDRDDTSNGTVHSSARNPHDILQRRWTDRT